MITAKRAFSSFSRIKYSADFQQIFRQGDRLSQGCLTVYVRRNCLGYARLGLAIAKKVVPKASSRNQVKRVIRESFRINHVLLPELDIVVIVSKRHSFLSHLLSVDLEKQWLSLVFCYKKL